MFDRNKRNKGDVISIQVIDKSSGKYKMVKTIGSSNDCKQIDKLVLKAEQWIRERQGLIEIDFTQERLQAEQILDSIQQITVSVTEILLGRIFDEIGFNRIGDDLFRQLVLARLCFPVSKLKTTEYLSRYHYIEVDVQNIYRNGTSKDIRLF